MPMQVQQHQESVNPSAVRNGLPVNSNIPKTMKRIAAGVMAADLTYSFVSFFMAALLCPQ